MSTWRIGDVPGAIQNGVNGCLFDPYEAGGLSRQIMFLLENAQTLRIISEAARPTKVESMENHAGKLYDVHQRARTNDEHWGASRSRALSGTLKPNLSLALLKARSTSITS